jgi:galactonate dehydratase
MIASGPVALSVGAHFSVAERKVMVREVVRAYYTDWYNDIVTGPPTVEAGLITPTSAPGLGVELKPGFLERPDAHSRVTSLA